MYNFFPGVFGDEPDWLNGSHHSVYRVFSNKARPVPGLGLCKLVVLKVGSPCYTCHFLLCDFCSVCYLRV